jgi:hypothetical protein
VVNRLAWIAGPVLGLVVFFFMSFLVLPHRAFTTPASVTPMPFLPALLIHMFGLGLPILKSSYIKSDANLRYVKYDHDRVVQRSPHQHD